MIRLDFGEQTKNDTFDDAKAKSIIIKDDAGDVVDLTGSTIKLQFRFLTSTGTLSKEITNGNGITVNDAAAGDISIDDFILDFNVGIHRYDIEVTNGPLVKTFTYGTIECVQDVTQD